MKAAGLIRLFFFSDMNTKFLKLRMICSGKSVFICKSLVYFSATPTFGWCPLTLFAQATALLQLFLLTWYLVTIGRREENTMFVMIPMHHELHLQVVTKSDEDGIRTDACKSVKKAVVLQRRTNVYPCALCEVTNAKPDELAGQFCFI